MFFERWCTATKTTPMSCIDEHLAEEGPREQEEKIILQQVNFNTCMNFTMKMPTVSVLLVALMLLTQATDGVKAPEKGKISKRHFCFLQTCEVLKQSRIMKQKLGVLETRLKNSETRLWNSETRLKNSEYRLKISENQILELKKKKTPMVVFSAATGGSGALGPFNIDKTLVYRAVKTNVGNAYSKITGIFTAPVDGVYYFTFFYHAGGAHPVGLNLMRNNQVVVMTYDHRTSSDGADNGGNAAFLQLQRGDRVYVRLSAHTHVWQNDSITTFSGFLVRHV
ncbi:uncharacterized protein LOC143317497 [Chaetodon auriga]|uniref:uncharacterized protein LOC143317497 n=1 Tax=Chaetodon auriga TaxID=39042 RepID=UPI004032AF37